MFRIFRRLQLILPGMINRLLLKLRIKKVPSSSDCRYCEYGQKEYSCDPPGDIPIELYEKYDDPDMPKHCGFYKSINQ